MRKFTRSSSHKMIAAKRTLSQEIRWGTITLTITVTILVVGLSVLYLAINSQKTAKGYLLRQIQLSLQSLQSQKHQIDTDLIEAKSFQNIQKTDVVQEMVPFTQTEITYITKPTGLAVK